MGFRAQDFFRRIFLTIFLFYMFTFLFYYGSEWLFLSSLFGNTRKCVSVKVFITTGCLFFNLGKHFSAFLLPVFCYLLFKAQDRADDHSL